MSKLTELLKYYNSNSYDRNKIYNSNKFKYIVLNSYNSEQKELLKGNESESTTLVIDEVLKTVADGAEKRAVFRKILPIFKGDSYKSNLTYSTVNEKYATITPEGGIVESQTSHISGNKVTIKKAITAPAITNEIIEDEKYSFIELELIRAGARLENTLNRECIDTLLEHHNGTTPADIDPTGSNIAAIDVYNATSSLRKLQWFPDTLIVHPTAEYRLQADVKNWGGAFDGSKVLMGNLKGYVLDIGCSFDVSKYWDDTDATSHYYGLVLDSMNYAGIIMRDDISTEKYEDPIGDLVRMTTKMRFGVGVMNNDAAVRILTK